MQGFNKKLNRAGSITIPAALRRELGIIPGERFRVTVQDEDGSIILKRLQGECLFCGSDKNLIVHLGRYVCAGCLESMNTKQVQEVEA